MTPELLWQISLMLLLAAALSLLAPLVGLPSPPLSAIAALLGLRLGIQLWRARLMGDTQHLFSLALSALLIILLLFAAGRGSAA